MFDRWVRGLKAMICENAWCEVWILEFVARNSNREAWSALNAVQLTTTTPLSAPYWWLEVPDNLFYFYFILFCILLFLFLFLFCFSYCSGELPNCLLFPLLFSFKFITPFNISIASLNHLFWSFLLFGFILPTLCSLAKFFFDFLSLHVLLTLCTSCQVFAFNWEGILASVVVRL